MTVTTEVFTYAPGRVNLLGEHTDYNQGLVLPTAIPQRTAVQLDLRDDLRVLAWSTTIGPGKGGAVHEYELCHEARGRGWLDYVQGATWALRQIGHRLSGFALHIESQIPTGSGLSSSAALLTAILRGLRQAFGLALSDLELAKLCQKIENEFVGAPVGLLDPLACGLCQRGQALFIDTQTLAIEELPLPSAVELVVIHSGVTHSHAANADAPAMQADYRTRRAECERAAELCGVTSLRELENNAAARRCAESLQSPLAARVRHVLTENERVREAAALLRGGVFRNAELEALGALFAASHRSQRDDYAVSVPEVDLLVELGARDPDILHKAARLTGGGFGGSVVMLARTGHGQAAAARIAAAYQKQTKRTATILVPEPTT